MRTPLLALHDRHDPLVGPNHPERYAELVAAAGRSEWLRLRWVERFGHVAFTTDEIMGAFAELVSWSKSMATVHGARRPTDAWA